MVNKNPKGWRATNLVDLYPDECFDATYKHTCTHRYMHTAHIYTHATFTQTCTHNKKNPYILLIANFPLHLDI